MSVRRSSTRVFVVAIMTALVVLLVAPAAFASGPADVCAEFPHKQTYVAEAGLFRAPAWHYDRTVTVVYETDSCEAEVAPDGNYTLSIEGTASIYDGLSDDGELLEKQPFTSEISSDSVDGKIGWPVRWWSCFDGSFSYVWTIEDVYVFSVVAEDGRWVMAQRDPTSDDVFARITNACRR